MAAVAAASAGIQSSVEKARGLGDASSPHADLHAVAAGVSHCPELPRMYAEYMDAQGAVVDALDAGGPDADALRQRLSEVRLVYLALLFASALACGVRRRVGMGGVLPRLERSC